MTTSMLLTVGFVAVLVLGMAVITWLFFIIRRRYRLVLAPPDSYATLGQEMHVVSGELQAALGELQRESRSLQIELERIRTGGPPR